MAKNRISKKRTKAAQPTTGIDLRKEQLMVAKMAESMAGTAKSLGLQVSGQVSIEGDGEKLIVLFSAYPNGDMMVWFLEKGYYSVMALVNQKTRHCSQIPATSPEVFQAELSKIKDIIGK